MPIHLRLRHMGSENNSMWDPDHEMSPEDPEQSDKLRNQAGSLCRHWKLRNNLCKGVGAANIPVPTSSPWIKVTRKHRPPWHLAAAASINKTHGSEKPSARWEAQHRRHQAACLENNINLKAAPVLTQKYIIMFEAGQVWAGEGRRVGPSTGTSPASVGVTRGPSVWTELYWSLFHGGSSPQLFNEAWLEAYPLLLLLALQLIFKAPFLSPLPPLLSQHKKEGESKREKGKRAGEVL